MKLGEKIRELIKASRFRNVSAFHRELTAIFEDKAVNYRTLSQIINNHACARERTLNQIAIILGMRTCELRANTDSQELEQEETLGAFTYNDKAVLRALENHLPFMPGKLVLKRGGRTTPEQDRPDGPKSVKWCAVIMGGVSLSVTGALGEEKKTFYKGAAFSFDARQKHCFANAYKGTTVLYIIHSPAVNSDLFLAPENNPDIKPA
ncbi:MAG: hypothetical protein HQL20_08335 [Candidatus Omnitrophica bacterium]|nr:hypothetical protein [Candidatus Omnitrophota bacterium]